MSSAPRPLDPRSATPAPDAGDSAPPATAPGAPPATTAGGTEVVGALAALETALAGFVRTRQRPGHDPQETERWEEEGGPSGAAPSAEVDARVVLGRERRAWAAHEVSQDEVARAVRAYARVLRGAGVPLAPTLAAVDAAVREHVTGRLPADVYDAVQRDAARSCLEAHYGP